MAAAASGYRFGRLGVSVSLCVLLACGGDDPGAVTVGEGGGESGGESGSKSPPDDNVTRDAGPGWDSGIFSFDAGPPSGAADGGGKEAGPLATCDGLNCGLNGDCAVNPMTLAAECLCDKGYVADLGAADTGICIEDKSCIELRALECDSRLPTGEVGITVSVSYCSGNPYTGVAAKDLHLEEKGSEDWEEVLASKTYASVVDREFASHVYFVVEVSETVKDAKVLDNITAGIRKLLDTLGGPGASSPPRVAVFGFDGKPYLYELVPETTDLAAAKAQLAILNTFEGNDPASTNLYGAVQLGLDRLDRAITLKNRVHDDGLLSAGTLVVISNGDDEASSVTLPSLQANIDKSVHKVITIGITSAQSNYLKLTQIGRDGSYSAPTNALLSKAFTDVAAAIKDFTDSLRFIGYCSPTRGSTFNARISVKGSNPVTCSFDAARFTGGCNASSFDPAQACAGLECGELLGCGECPAGECCVAGHCMAAAPRALGATCGAEWMCPTAMVCNGESKCDENVVSIGTPCGGATLCNPEEALCKSPDGSAPTECMAGLSVVPGLAYSCTDNVQCTSGHCGPHPDYPGGFSNYCMPPARMFEACSAPKSAGSCEPGTFCDESKRCLPQLHRRWVCTYNGQCLSGECVRGVGDTSYCQPQSQCYFAMPF